MNTVLKVKNIEKYYGNKKNLTKAINNISFEVDKGEFVGIINFPTFPVSVCFGDEDMKTLYITSYSNIYRIRTNMTGFIQEM